MKKILTFALLIAAAFAAEGYKVIAKIKIGGEGGWDYVALDTVNRRLYASHGNSVEVVDPDAGKVVGTIPGLHGVHGIAIANDLGKGFITNGDSNSVTIFDLKTLAKSGEPATGTGPDAVCYEPKTKRVFTINHRGGDATVIDAKTGEVLVKSIPVGASAEFCQADGAGKLYVNIESLERSGRDRRRQARVTRRTSILPVRRPQRPGHRREGQEALLGVRQRDGRDRHPHVQSGRHAGHRQRPGCRRFRFRPRPGLQLQRRAAR